MEIKLRKIDFLNRTQTMDLYEIAKWCQLEHVKKTITPENVLTVNPKGLTALQGAACNNTDDPAIVNYIIDCGGARILPFDVYPIPQAMMHAIGQNNPKCLQVLATLHKKITYDPSHLYALFNCCIVKNRRKCARILVEHGTYGSSIYYIRGSKNSDWLFSYIRNRTTCGQNAIILMGIRKKRQSILNTQPTDVIKLIGQTLWNMRLTFPIE
jgi:hypothetical protein